MRQCNCIGGWVCLLVLVLAINAAAQESEPAAPAPSELVVVTPQGAVPRLVKFSGVLPGAQSEGSGHLVGVTFALYREQQGGAPLWVETQNVEVDAEGRYAVLLGATKNEGVPVESFLSGEARWLGIQAKGQEEQRVLLVAVPYAFKAADADTLGGKPASAFVLIPPGDDKQNATLPPSSQPANALGGLAPFYTATSTTGPSFISLATSGPPLVVSSTEPVANLNADLIDGKDSTEFVSSTDGTVGIGAPVDPETQLTVERTGTTTADSNGLVVTNTANNFGTDGTRKTGAKVRSIGSFPGGFGAATINTGLDVQVDGADVNQAATFMGGNVGIGTTTPDPSAALEVVGDVRINSVLDLGTDPCSAPSQAGRGQLCFNGTEFVVSENGGAYQDVLSAGDTVSGSTTPAILKAVQNAPGVMNPSPLNLPPSAFLGEATSTTDSVVGVVGVASGTGSNETIGVAGLSFSTDGIGVAANSLALTGATKGIDASVESPNGTAASLTSPPGGLLIDGSNNSQQVFRVDASGNVNADGNLDLQGNILALGTISANGAGDSGVGGNFGVGGNLGVNGNVTIGGTLSKGGGSFRIDHPLDPANKYLFHSFVESPDMKNIYDGVVVLDKQGEAVVELPEWFEVLNSDFRYQLTCVGAYAPVYVAEEIQDNRFKIAGGRPGLKVSWQVTGVRQDPYARDHRIRVEEEKPLGERGHYLYPEGYRQPKERRVEYAHRPQASSPGENNRKRE